MNPRRDFARRYRDWWVLPIAAAAGAAIITGGAILLAADTAARAWQWARRG